MQRLRGLTRTLLRHRHQITVKVNEDYRETIHFTDSLSITQLLEELKERKYRGVDEAGIYTKSGVQLPSDHVFHRSHGTVTVNPPLQHPSATSPAPPSSSTPRVGGGGGVSVMDHLQHNRPSATTTKTGTSSSSSSSDKVFGAPVETWVDSNNVPLVISKTINFLDNALHLTEQGLFRISGVKSEIDELRHAFDRNGGSFDIPDHTDPHNVSVLLKLYLKTLPEPLFPFTVFNTVIQIEKDYPEDEVQQVRQVQHIIDQQLDIVRRQALRHLLLFLAKLASFANVNQMTAANIAIVIGPNILRPEVETMAIFQQMAAINRITERIIRHASFVCHQHPPSFVACRSDSLSHQRSVHLGTHTLSSSSLSSSSTSSAAANHPDHTLPHQAGSSAAAAHQHRADDEESLIYGIVVRLSEAVRDADGAEARRAVDEASVLVDGKSALAGEVYRKEFCEAGGIRETVAAMDVLGEVPDMVSGVVGLWLGLMQGSRAVAEGKYQPGPGNGNDQWRDRWNDQEAANWMQDRDKEAEGSITEGALRNCNLQPSDALQSNTYTHRNSIYPNFYDRESFIEYWRQEDDEENEDEEGDHAPTLMIHANVNGMGHHSSNSNSNSSSSSGGDADMQRVITRTLRVMVMTDPSPSLETLTSCVAVLGYLTNIHRYRMAIQHYGGVPCIFHLLNTTQSLFNNSNNNSNSNNSNNNENHSNHDPDQITTLTARLLQLLRRFLKSRRSKSFVIAHNAIPLVTSILHGHPRHHRIVQNALIALHLLANNKATTAASSRFADANVLPIVYLIATQHFPRSPDILRYTASLTALLVSFHPSRYVPYATQVGAVPTLTFILDSPVAAANALIVTPCVRALGRIAKQFPDEVRRHHAVSLCVGCLQQFPESIEVHRYALRALAVMAVGDTQHVVYRSGAVGSAVGALAVFGGERQGKALGVLSVACRMLEQVLQSSPQAARDEATQGLTVGLVHLVAELHDNDEVANDAVHALAALVGAGGEEVRRQVAACGALRALYQLKTMHQSMPQASNVARALVEQIAHDS